VEFNEWYVLEHHSVRNISEEVGVDACVVHNGFRGVLDAVTEADDVDVGSFVERPSTTGPP